MSDITLAKDVNDFGDKPAGTSDEDFRLFEARRRVERARIDEAEGRITTSPKT